MPVSKQHFYEQVFDHLHEASEKLRPANPHWAWIESCPVDSTAWLHETSTGRGVSIVKAFTRNRYRLAHVVLIGYQLFTYLMKEYPGFQIDYERYDSFVELVRQSIDNKTALAPQPDLYGLPEHPRHNVHGPLYTFTGFLPSKWRVPTNSPGLSDEDLIQYDIEIPDYGFQLGIVDPEYLELPYSEDLIDWGEDQLYLLNLFIHILNPSCNWSRGELKRQAQYWINHFAEKFGYAQLHLTMFRDPRYSRPYGVFNAGRHTVVCKNINKFINHWFDLVAHAYPLRYLMSRTGKTTLDWD